MLSVLELLLTVGAFCVTLLLAEDISALEPIAETIFPLGYVFCCYFSYIIHS